MLKQNGTLVLEAFYRSKAECIALMQACQISPTDNTPITLGSSLRDSVGTNTGTHLRRITANLLQFCEDKYTA